MRFKDVFDLCRKSVNAWIDDYAPSMGAAIAYYTMFSLAPLLVIVIAVAGAVFGQEAVQGEIAAQLTGLIGREGALAVQGLVRSASEPDRGLIAGSVGLVLLIVGATTVFAELQSALDRVWHVPEREKPQGVWAVLRARLLSFGLILTLAFLLMVSLVVSASVAALGSWAGTLMAGAETLFFLLNFVVSLAILTTLFAMIFKFMPSVPIGWRDVWIGALVTAVLFEIGKFAIGLYLGKSSVTESFAAAGSLVVLLAWVYYAAQVFLLGAEFTKVHADAHGNRSGERAVKATEVAAVESKVGLLPAGQKAAMCGDGLDPAEELAVQVRTRRDVERRIERARQDLAQQLVVLLALAVAKEVLARWKRRLKRRSTY